MSIVLGIVDSSLEKHYYPLNAPWLYGDNQSDDNPSFNGFTTAFFSLITFQNIVPISLYISIEGVRTVQALFIYFDREIYYEKTDQATLSRSWNLSDDLGQIEYIFSDKTGTLTQNQMVFQQCSVGGKAYKGDEEEEEEEEIATKYEGSSSSVEVDIRPSKSSSRSGSPRGSGSGSGSRPNTGDDDIILIHDTKSSPTSKSNSMDKLATPDASNPKTKGPVKLSEGVLKHFRDSGLKADIAAEKARELDLERNPFASRMNGFWTTLALCHTVLASVDPERGAIEYKAQSPDEAALVQAAADVGFVFRGREREILTLSTPFSEDEWERWELLNVLEFTSARKRMSVVLKRVGGDEKTVYVFSKGADNVIFERLVPGDDEFKNLTEDHLGEFAGDGLRTLTLAYRTIPRECLFVFVLFASAPICLPGTDSDTLTDFLTLNRSLWTLVAEYEDWNRRYSEANAALENREELVDAVSSELEQGLHLLGATAIEDKLQDGVPETIADLKEAGIKVWVATGDKLETAIGEFAWLSLCCLSPVIPRL